MNTLYLARVFIYFLPKGHHSLDFPRIWKSIDIYDHIMRPLASLSLKIPGQRLHQFEAYFPSQSPLRYRTYFRSVDLRYSEHYLEFSSNIFQYWIGLDWLAGTGVATTLRIVHRPCYSVIEKRTYLLNIVFLKRKLHENEHEIHEKVYVKNNIIRKGYRFQKSSTLCLSGGPISRKKNGLRIP